MGCALLLAAHGTSAQVASSALPPWREADDLPLPADATSVVVDHDDQPIWSEPSLGSARRGAAMLGVRLPFFAAKRADGCAARWLSVGPEAWICQDALHFDAAPPITAARLAPPAAAPGGLPYRYDFVGPGGANGYARLADAGEVAPDGELQPGFAVAVVDEGVKEGARYLRTHHGLWVAERDLVPVAPFLFHGAEVEGGELKLAWVIEDKAPVFASPTAARASRNEAKFERFQLVRVLDEVPTKSGGWIRVGEGAWLRARDVRKPTLSARPLAVAAGERWIDVDRATQTLVAYEGDRPVFATLVSTGKGRDGSEDATPTGEFRIWVKLVTSTMDNLEDEQAQRYYAIEDVPYVQYFAKGVGLHGAFWHRAFGRVRSHGCVNLAPLDAQRLFAFTGPHMPAGWAAVLPTKAEPGTLVRVR